MPERRKKARTPKSPEEIKKAIHRHKGNVSKTAKALGLSPGYVRTFRQDPRYREDFALYEGGLDNRDLNSGAPSQYSNELVARLNQKIEMWNPFSELDGWRTEGVADKNKVGSATFFVLYDFFALATYDSLALELGITRQTLFEWRKKTKEYANLSYVVDVWKTKRNAYFARLIPFMLKYAQMFRILAPTFMPDFVAREEKGEGEQPPGNMYNLTIIRQIERLPENTIDGMIQDMEYALPAGVGR